MPPEEPTDNPADEIEIDLDEATELRLHEIDIDADAPPIEFTIEGVIRDVDSNVMEQIAGSAIQPTAIRFQVVNNRE